MLQTKNLKKAYNASWALVTGSSSGGWADQRAIRRAIQLQRLAAAAAGRSPFSACVRAAVSLLL